MTDFDKLLPHSIYAMPLDELRALKVELKRFELKLIERIQSLETPPPLGVSVRDGIATDDKVG